MGAGADRLPVAQNRERVGDLLNLFEKVRDVDDRKTLRAKRANDREELLHVIGREAAGGLVENEHPAARLRYRAGNLHELLTRRREIAHPGLGAQHGVASWIRNLCERGEGELSHLGAPKQAERRRLGAEQHVLGNRKVRTERKLLVNHRDARAPRIERAWGR